MQKIVFVVDDSDTNLAMAELAMEQHYKVITMSSAVRMFDLLKKVTPDLILLDIDMPEMSGFDALRQMQSDLKMARIPVIFLTAMSDAVNESYGLELGAVDFIAKPFSKPVLLNRLRHHLFIEEQINGRVSHLLNLQNSIVFMMAELVESRDTSTGGHIERSSQYTKILVEAMLERGVYADEIALWNLETFISSTRLHDLGKIAIPDAILNKPAVLTDEEYHVMKTHPLESKRILDDFIDRTNGAEFLLQAKLSAVYHHERWDGKGYPYGLKGKDIPLQGRIVAIPDVYDALTSERPYKPALSEDEAMSIISDGIGTLFDPDIARVFLEVQDKIIVEHRRLTERAAGLHLGTSSGRDVVSPLAIRKNVDLCILW